MADFDGIAEAIQELAEDSRGEKALWSVSSERGNVRGRLHGQIMMGVCAAMNITHGTALNGAIKAKLADKFGAGKYKVSCTKLTGNGGVHSNVLTAMGYTFKDRNKEWYVNRSSDLLTPNLQKTALRNYLIFANLAGKNTVMLDNKIIFDRVYTYLHIGGTDPVMMNDNGVIRVQTVVVMMLRSGQYSLGKSFATSNFGAMDYARSQALVNLQQDPVNAKLSDVQLLLFGLDINDPVAFDFWREEDASVLPKPTQEQVIAAAERAAVQADAAEQAADGGSGSDIDDDTGFLAEATARPRDESIAENLAFVRSQHARRNRLQRALGPMLELHIFIGETGVGKTRGAKFMWPDSIDYLMEPDTNKPWYGSTEMPVLGSKVFIDDIIDNRVPDKPVSFLAWPYARAVFSTGPCMLQTKHGKDVDFKCAFIIVTSTIKPERWYTLPNGDIQPEWLRRLVDFAIIYEVKRGDLCADGKLTTQGVRYRDVATARLATFAAERAAQEAAMDAALGLNDDDI
jgi:hypothetical protein